MQGASVKLANPQRLKQLEIRRILDTPREEVFDRITRLASQTLHAPIALLTFVDDHRQWFKSAVGLSEPWQSRRETPLSHSFCQYVVAFARPLVVSDARSEPLVKDNLAVPVFNLIAYLGVPLIDSDGSVLGSLAVGDHVPRTWSQRDVETLVDFAAVTMIEVELRTQIAQRTQLLEDLNRSQRFEAIGKLAAGVAHDFGNLLLIIKGYIGLLVPHVAASQTAVAHLDEIQRAAERGSLLTQQLLAVGRQQPYSPRRIDVVQLIRDIETTLRKSLPGSMRLALNLDERAAWVIADPIQLERVVLNLVINARDASPQDGEIQVRVRTRDRAPEHAPIDELRARRCIEIEVRDFGTGIDPKDLPHIFEPFYTTKRDTNGTGLGLAIVRGIVQQNHGVVFVESAPQQGSTFHVLLPAVQENGQ